MTEVNPATGPSPIQAISAVTLVTADMASGVAFYDALGFALAYGGPDALFTSYRVGGSYLNLQVAPRGQSEVWGRVIFWVDDVDSLHARAVAAELHPSSPPTDAEWGERFFHIRDPDGHELSFARPLDS
ncbi:MAG: VOC family protein [Aquihabitans sp.]